MPAVDFDGPSVVDPDTLKLPESPAHRRVAELLAAVAEYLDPSLVVYCDMNWYPNDGGHALAPDVMTLPPGVLASTEKSYRQGADGPRPGVAVEIVSDSDTFAGFLGKTRRYRRLGVPVYVVVIDSEAKGVLRLAPDSADQKDWTGRPILELGGLRLVVEDDAVAVPMPTGDMVRSRADLVRLGHERADRLAAQLRALGAEPVD